LSPDERTKSKVLGSSQMAAALIRAPNLRAGELRDDHDEA
jgi:hypothetical protein